MATPELDLVFLCDCTSSMGSYIESAKSNIRKIIEDIKACEKRDVQFALIQYRDHCDSFVTKVSPWTSKTKVAFEYVSQMSPQGGGDGPEAVADALHEVNCLNFRKTASKICVIIADAPPHGITLSADTYPSGSPNGHDPISIVHQLVTKEIIIYAVGCEPALSSYTYASDYFKAIAYMTGGRYIALGNVAILPNIIIGGANEEMDLSKLTTEIVNEKENKDQSEAEILEKVHKNLSDRGLTCNSLVVDDLGDASSITDLTYKIAKCKTLPEVKELINSINSITSSSTRNLVKCHATYRERERERDRDSRDSRSDRSRSPIRSVITTASSVHPTVAYQSQQCMVNISNISATQVQRVLNRNKKV